MTRVEELYQQVRALSPDEREEFALLLETGSGEDLGLSPEWDAEIRRRREDFASGNATTVPWDEVETRLERRLRGGSWD